MADGSGTIEGQQQRVRSGRRGRRPLFVSALALVVVAAACGSTKKSNVSPSTPLEGTHWVLSGSTSLGVPVGDVAVSAQFENGTVGGTSGCNTYRASSTSNGSRLTIGPIASTQMACDPDRMAVERAYLDRLAMVAGFTISGSQLTLSDSSGKPVLEFNASSGASALMGAWSATSYFAVTAISSVVGGVNLTAEFAATTVTGSGGCNTFNGPYEVNGSSIKIGPLISTLKACATPELDQQEQHYLAALQLATTYKVTGSRLDLYRADGGYAVTFHRP